MIKRFPLRSDLINVSLALNLFRFSTSMAGIFIPLVILQSGGSLWMIAAFYLIYSVAKLCMNYQAMRFTQRKGAHYGLGTGFTFGILQLTFVLGYSFTHSIIFLVLSALSLALTNAFVWNAQHLFISRALTEKTASSSIASIEIVGQTLSIIGPLLGAMIGGFFGATCLLVCASLVASATLLPLTRMRKEIASHNKEEELTYTLSGAPVRDLIANFCFNTETTISIMLWPVYLAVVLHSYQSIGSISALSAAASILTVWIAGKRGDKGKDRAVLFEGVSIVSAINILRLFVHSLLGIGAISAAYRSSLSYLQNSWTSTYYSHAKSRGSQYIISMEIACDLAYVFVWGILLLALVVSASDTTFFTISFILAAAAAWGCLLIANKSKLAV